MKCNWKIIYVVLLMLLKSQISSFDIETPKEPTLPQTPKVEKEKKRKSLSILLELCNHRKIEGFIYYQKDKIEFKHIREGIEFRKKLKLSEIKQIRILNWKFKKEKKTKYGRKYTMLPRKVEIITFQNQFFIMEGLESTEFMSVEINNSYGKAKLYSFWIDLLKKNNTWYSKLPKVDKDYREECHPDVIRSIHLNYQKPQGLS